MTEPADSDYWPAEIGRLVLDGSTGLMLARYVDPLDGAEYRAGREQGGQRHGWWVWERDQTVRSDGYRSFAPADQDAAIRRLRSMASADVGVGERAEVNVAAEIEASDQGTLSV